MLIAEGPIMYIFVKKTVAWKLYVYISEEGLYILISSYVNSVFIHVLRIHTCTYIDILHICCNVVSTDRTWIEQYNFRATVWIVPDYLE